MKPDLISQLRARGYDVHLRHEYSCRYGDGALAGVTRHEIGACASWYDSLTPTPIQTVATVRTEGGAEATAIATVSPKDQFCRKRGRQIAIGRALKQLGTSFKRLEIRP